LETKDNEIRHVKELSEKRKKIMMKSMLNIIQQKKN
jgi:hypothetical protein